MCKCANTEIGTFATLLYMSSNLFQIGTHPPGVFFADDVQQLVQFGADAFHVCRGAGVEQDFL